MQVCVCMCAHVDVEPEVGVGVFLDLTPVSSLSQLRSVAPRWGEPASHLCPPRARVTSRLPHQVGICGTGKTGTLVHIWVASALTTKSPLLRG